VVLRLSEGGAKRTVGAFLLGKAESEESLVREEKARTCPFHRVRGLRGGGECWECAEDV